jgi:hypothetical protein
MLHVVMVLGMLRVHSDVPGQICGQAADAAHMPLHQPHVAGNVFLHQPPCQRAACEKIDVLVCQALQRRRQALEQAWLHTCVPGVDAAHDMQVPEVWQQLHAFLHHIMYIASSATKS